MVTKILSEKTRTTQVEAIAKRVNMNIRQHIRTMKMA